MPDPTPTDRPLWPFRLLIGLIVLAALCRLCASDFSWWDDQLTIHQNQKITNPTFASLVYYWTEPTMGLYVPVTYTVWAAIGKIAYVAEPGDEMIFLNPWFFHTANVLVHIGSSLLAFGILRRLFGRIDAAFIGALFFGLHPVQVETIGWVSGMKDLLCWMFSLSIVLLYVKRVQAVVTTRRPLWASWELPACCALLVLGILSKPTAMVTPAALLLIDGLLLRRNWLRTALELLPLFLITAGGAWIARVAQYVDTVKPSPLWQRPFIVGDNVLFYLTKIVWPRHLCIDYSRTFDNVMANPTVYWHWIIPAALGVLVLFNLRRRPVLAAGAGIFLIGFSPVSGVVTFQMQNISLTTDHYLYFSMFGIALIVAWLVTISPRRAAYVAATVLLLALGVRSFLQTGAWGDSQTLFRSTVAANPRSAVARNNLAAAYMGGFFPRTDLAEPLLEEAIRFKPNFSDAHANLARVKASLSQDARESGDLETAERKKAESFEHFDIAWKQRVEAGVSFGDRAMLAHTIAETMVELDEIDKALWWAEKSEELYPNDYANRQLLASIRGLAATRPSTRPGATTNPSPRDGSASGQ